MRRAFPFFVVQFGNEEAKFTAAQLHGILVFDVDDDSASIECKPRKRPAPSSDEESSVMTTSSRATLIMIPRRLRNLQRRRRRSTYPSIVRATRTRTRCRTTRTMMAAFDDPTPSPRVRAQLRELRRRFLVAASKLGLPGNPVRYVDC